MKKRLLLFSGIIILASLTTPALMAFDAKKQDRKITITLSEQDWNVVLQGLSELPLKISQPVYGAIMQQAQAQLAPPQKAKADSTTAKPKKP